MKTIRRLFAPLERKKFRPIPVLVRHFFSRLFQNDFVAFEDQMKEKTISILAIIAIFSAHVSNSVLMKYMFVEDDGRSWLEKCFFTSFVMLILGFITVFEWDVLFLDSRDFANLRALPVRLRTLFAAKFMSLCCFVGLFVIGANIFAAFPFWFYLPKWQAEGDLVFFTRFFLVHMVSLFAASFFIFFAAAFLIGILMLLFPERLFRVLSLFIRTLMMIFFVYAILQVFSASLGYFQPFEFFAKLKSARSPLFYAFPPVWFTGLYETLLGNGDPQFKAVSWYALVSLASVTFGFFIMSALVYRKYCRTAEIRKKANRRPAGFMLLLKSVFDSVVLAHPVQRGIFYFFGKTLKSSMVHKLRLAAFVSVGLAFGLILLVVNSGQNGFFAEPNRTMLSIPLILTFFLVIGVRSVVNIPTRLEANWIFRITENKNLRHYRAGLRKGIVLFLLIPPAVLVSAFSCLLWGWSTGLLHGIFGLVLSVLLMEILFLKHNKIPFACACLPGQAKVHLLWPAYVLSFLVYVGFSATAERFLLKKPLIFAVFFLGVFALLMAGRIFQNRFLNSRLSLVYGEEPEPALVTLLTYSHD